MNSNVEFSSISASEAQKLLEANVDWAKYDGRRVTGTVDGRIYLALHGTLRWIPNKETFNKLFKNWDGIEKSDYLIDNMPHGNPLTDNALLARGDRDTKVYLVSNGQKMHIPNPGVAEKFNFDLNKTVVVPQVLIDYYPTGPSVG